MLALRVNPPPKLMKVLAQHIASNHVERREKAYLALALTFAVQGGIMSGMARKGCSGPAVVFVS